MPTPQSEEDHNTLALAGLFEIVGIAMIGWVLFGWPGAIGAIGVELILSAFNARKKHSKGN